MRRAVLSSGLLLASLLGLAGCAPRLAPLYRDYRVPAEGASPRLARALAGAGWALDSTAVPGVLLTRPRDGASFGLYRMRLSVEAVPLGADHVRLLFQPVRAFTARRRTHVPYLPGGLQRTFVPDLDRALKAEGFTPEASGALRDYRTRREAARAR